MDEEGQPVPIANDAVLFRRIPPVFRQADGGTRPSSNAFDDSPDGSPMSVYVESILLTIGRSYVDVVVGHDGYGLVSFTADKVRALDWDVRLGGAAEGDPLGLAHAGVLGKKTHSKQAKIARTCTKVVWP